MQEEPAYHGVGQGPSDGSGRREGDRGHGTKIPLGHPSDVWP